MYLVLQFILYEAEKYFYIGLTVIGKQVINVIFSRICFNPQYLELNRNNLQSLFSFICFVYMLYMHSKIRPVTVVALPKICTAFYTWKSGVVYLNATRVFIYVCSYSVYVSSCIKKSIANKRISSQESKQASSKNTQ